MATTEEYKNGGSASYSFSIEYIKAEDIKVTVDGTDLTYTATNPPAQTTEYTVNGSNVIFKQASVSGSATNGVRIYRETSLESSDSATFVAGSSIRAADLNNNHNLLKFSAQEKNQKVTTSDIRDSAITSAKILDGTIAEADIANSAVTSNKIADNAVTTTEILNGAVTTNKIADDAVTSAKLANNSVNHEQIADDAVRTSEIQNDAVTTAKIVDSSVTNSKLATNSVGTSKIIDGVVTTDKLNNQAVTSAKIAPLNVTTGKIADDAVTIDKIADAAIVTNGEQASHTVDDNTFFTTAAAEARYFNASTGETIKNGDTFPDNDTTIATTAAINDRIIDLVDDVGGFVPLSNETSFPTSNPDINGGGGTVVSVKAASTDLVPSGTTVTIANGRGTGLPVIITSVPSTIPQGFGFIVETTSTDHTYAFHRLSPKATEVTTVAGKATEIGRLGTAAAVEDMSILGTTDVVADMNLLGTTDVVADMNMLATTDVISDMNTLAVTSVVNNIDTVATNVANVNTTAGSISNVNTTAGSISNVNTVAGSITNVNTTAGSIGNVNTVAGSIASVNNAQANLTSINNFGDQYQVAANNPSTDGGGNALAAGDLYFNTSANELKVYNGSSWQGGVTAAGSFAATTGNTFTGDNKYNDGVKALFGTGSDLEIYHDSSHNSYINNTNGTLRLLSNNHIVLEQLDGDNLLRCDQNGAVNLYYDNSKKLETTSAGVAINTTNTSHTLEVGGSVRTTAQIKGYSGNHTVPSFTFDSATSTGMYLLNSNGTIGFSNAGTHTATLDNSGNLLLVGDNQKLQLGAGQDLQIYHSGSGSYIRDVGTGTLYLDTNGNDISLISDGSVSTGKMGRFFKDAQVELYHDNNKKFETTSAGIDVTGTTTDDGARHDGDVYFIGATSGRNVLWDMSEDALEFADNAKATFGTGNDLEIFHDGNQSRIKDVGTGNLVLQGSGIRLNTSATSMENMITADEGDAVKLYFNNSKKFETTSGGASVSGILNLSNNLDMPDSAKVILGTGDDLQIYHDGSNSHIAEAGTGVLKISGSAGVYINKHDNSETMAAFLHDAGVELYHNNNKYFETATNGGIFRGTTWTAVDNCKHTFGTGDDLKIYHDGTDSIIGNETGTLQFLSPNEVRYRATTHHFLSYGNDETMAKFIDDGAVELYQNNDRKLVTIPNGARIESAAGDTYLDVYAEEDAAGVDAYVRIRTEGTTQNCYLMFGDGDDSYIGGLKYEHSGDKLEFIANNAERGSVDSAGLWTFGDGFRLVDDKVGRFGSGDDLKIYHNGTSSYIDNNKNHLYIRNNVDGDDDGNIYIQAKSGENSIVCNDDGAVNIYHNNTLKIGTDAGGVVIAGDLDLSQNDLFLNNGTIIATDADGAFANRTGSNIDHLWHNDTDNAWNFCSDTTYRNFGNSTLNCSAVAFGNSSSNVQNDYEEGAWTPSITFGGSATSQTYTTNVGRYVKVGRLVHIQCHIELSDKGSSTGTARIAGLPFTTRNQSSLHPAAVISYFDKGNSSSGPGSTSTFMVYGDINQSTLNVNREEITDNIPEMNDAQDYNFADDTQLMLTMTYISN